MNNHHWFVYSVLHVGSSCFQGNVRWRAMICFKFFHNRFLVELTPECFKEQRTVNSMVIKQRLHISLRLLRQSTAICETRGVVLSLFWRFMFQNTNERLYGITITKTTNIPKWEWGLRLVMMGSELQHATTHCLPCKNEFPSILYSFRILYRLPL